MSEKKEYIERGDAINIITMGISNAMSSERAIAYSDITRRINAIPSADVEPVVRGEWITVGKITKCSNCGNPAIYTMSGRLNTTTRCDLCGAHMREKPNE